MSRTNKIVGFTTKEMPFMNSIVLEIIVGLLNSIIIEGLKFFR